MFLQAFESNLLHDQCIALHAAHGATNFHCQYVRISPRNCFVMGKPAAEPITESTSHRGQRAVSPPPFSGIQSVISEGRKMARQEKQPHASLTSIRRR